MTTPTPLNTPAKIAVAALAFLGWVGACLVVAHGGWETSPRRGGPSTFVPAPLGTVMAVVLFAMSWLAVVALLRDRGAPARTVALALAAHLAAAVAFVAWLGPI